MIGIRAGAISVDLHHCWAHRESSLPMLQGQMRTAMTAFNSPHDDGRPTVLLLHLEHAFEMLLRAALLQGGSQGLRQEVRPQPWVRGGD
jgi:hypothetical protein